MHRLLLNQLAKARTASGDIDADQLHKFVSDAYKQFERDRVRSDRATKLLIEELDELNAARDATLAALAIQNRNLDVALESMDHGLSLFDAGHRLVTSNRRYAEMYHLPEHIVVPGVHLLDLIDFALNAGVLDDARIVAATKETLAAIPNSKTLERVWRLSNKRVISFRISRLDDGGWVAVHKDVTDQIMAEKRIAASEQRFRDFTTISSDWCWETDSDHRFVYLSETFETITGLAPARLLGKRIDDLNIQDDQRADFERYCQSVFAHQPCRDVLLSIRLPNGRPVFIKSSGLPRFDHRGTFLGFRGTAADVTREQERKLLLERTEELLKARSDQLMEAQRIGKLGDWNCRLDSQTFWLSPEAADLLRYDAERSQMTRDSFLAICDDDGAHRIAEAQAEVLRSGRTISVDVRLRRGDGTTGDFAITSKTLTGRHEGIIGFTGTIQDISARKYAEKQLELLAYYDPLTGLANRVLFRRQVEDVILRSSRSNRRGALLLLDLDRFKEVNDSLGHAAGDELLIKVAQLVSRVLDRGQFLARLGGDEFAIVVPEFADLPAIERLAADAIAAVSGSIVLERGEVSIGASIGIVLIPTDGLVADDLLRNADLALYRAKEGGRGRFAYFQPEMSAIVQHKMSLARDLRTAVSDNFGLTVHYQPQVNLVEGRVVGYEALLRWRHPTIGNIPPSEFIPIAESSRLICDLGQWILREAARQARAWLDAGESAREISINVSATQLWHSDLVAEVRSVLEETRIPPHLLCLELTESLLADQAEGRVRTVLKSLKSLGVTLALDDFGKDYSSLGYLIRLPFDRLKIDQIFIRGAANAERSRELLNGIVALGRGLGMKVVGEGAEAAEEVALLRACGCDLVQGYVFSRPIAATEAVAFARNFRPSQADALQYQDLPRLAAAS